MAVVVAADDIRGLNLVKMEDLAVELLVIHPIFLIIKVLVMLAPHDKDMMVEHH